MTLQQEAYRLIDHLPEDSVRAVIQIMVRMLPAGTFNTVSAVQNQTDTPKQHAFKKIQELRNATKEYHILDFEAERTDALKDKYDRLV